MEKENVQDEGNKGSLLGMACSWMMAVRQGVDKELMEHGRISTAGHPRHTDSGGKEEKVGFFFLSQFPLCIGFILGGGKATRIGLWRMVHTGGVYYWRQVVLRMRDNDIESSSVPPLTSAETPSPCRRDPRRRACEWLLTCLPDAQPREVVLKRVFQERV